MQLPFKHESLLIDSEEDRMTEVEKYVAMKTFHQQMMAMRKGVSASTDQMRAQQHQQLMVQQQATTRPPPNPPTVSRTGSAKATAGTPDVICIDSDSDDDSAPVKSKPAPPVVSISQELEPRAMSESLRASHTRPLDYIRASLGPDSSVTGTTVDHTPSEAAVARAFAGFIQLQKNLCQQMSVTPPLTDALQQMQQGMLPHAPPTNITPPTSNILPTTNVPSTHNTPPTSNVPPTNASYQVPYPIVSSFSSTTAVIAPTPRVGQLSVPTTVSLSAPVPSAPSSSPLLALINSLQQSNNPSPRKAAIVAPITISHCKHCSPAGFGWGVLTSDVISCTSSLPHIGCVSFINVTANNANHCVQYTTIFIIINIKHWLSHWYYYQYGAFQSIL